MLKQFSIVIVPNKLRYINFIQKYLNSEVVLIQYRYDSGYNGITGVISQALGDGKVINLALVLYSTPFGVYICSNDGIVQKFSYEYLVSSSSQKEFFTNINSFFHLENADNCRLDLINCNLSSRSEIPNIMALINQFIQVPCFISKDLWGNDIILENPSEDKRTASDFYFSNTNLNSNANQQSMDNFEKIRIVGKGAFGTAVLYKKKDDDSLVILKEINMHDLSATERQLAMNEVKVLSLLDHPNIVAYFDSFEEDGILIIEMEYADNGTLCQYLSAQTKPLDEKEVLELFQQIVAAIHYIHEHKILHRDLKTANIFLTKEKIIKIGDFGISKMLTTTLSGAHSVIGTPHYISPEMCQGKVYNEKSDVWALGCILYEMVCLHKTFEGSNLPAIVNKIIKCQFETVKGNYSDELKELISSMLQKNPDERTSTDVILYHKIPMMRKKFEIKIKNDSKPTLRDSRSVLYVMDIETLSLIPVSLPPKVRIKQVCSSVGHVIVLTTDMVVYTWGHNKYGQLGHGDTIDRMKPESVSSLVPKSLCRISCGNNYSIFGSENGIIMTCGQGLNGCLGHGDFRDVYKPKLIESLLSVDITCISTTSEHVIVISSENIVYGWGSNRSGQLGLSNNTVYGSPQEIRINEPVIINNAFTSEDATILLTDAGALFASGNNYGNKLGLNARLGFLMTMKSMAQQPSVSGVTEFTSVRTLSRHRVSQVSMGSFHTIVICQSGKVVSFGVNTEGQLGNGHTKIIPITSEVKALRKHTVTKIASGPNYSVAYVNYNSLYFWGKRKLQKDAEEVVGFTKALDKAGVSSNHSSEDSQPRPIERSISESNTDSTSPRLVPDGKSADFTIYTTPVLILHLKNSSDDNPNKELICLTNCITYGDSNLLVQIETTAPPPKRTKRRSKTVVNLRKMDSSTLKPNIPSHDYPNTVTLTKSLSETLDEESMPTWVKKEFLDAMETEKNPIATVDMIPQPTTDDVDPMLARSPLSDGQLSKHSLRIYSTSDQKCSYSNTTKSFSDSFESTSLPTRRYREYSHRRNKSEVNFVSKTANSRDQQLEKQLNNLQIQLQTQQHVIAKSTVLINKLKSEIDRLHMERHGDGVEPGKPLSTVCTIQ